LRDAGFSQIGVHTNAESTHGRYDEQEVFAVAFSAMELATTLLRAAAVLHCRLLLHGTGGCARLLCYSNFLCTHANELAAAFYLPETTCAKNRGSC
jgi:hypothetical protein